MKNKKIQFFLRILPALLLLPYASLGQGIDIGSGASIVVTGAVNIQLNNQGFINNGSYTKGAETITFSGNSAKTISGSSSTDLNDVSVTNTGGITIQIGLLTSNNITVAPGSKFTVEPAKFVTVNGALTLNDSIILKSTSAGTASLLTKGAVSGSKARVERYIGGASWAWHFLSSPVTTQAISGGFTPSTSGYDFYTWYEPALLWVNFKNTTTAPTWNTANGSNYFMPGRGYLVAYEATNTTKNFTGLPNNGLVEYTLTTGGASTYQYFNLVGNPYPCSIDWKADAGWTRDNLNGSEKSFWIWNDVSGNYGTYSTATSGDVGINGTSRYISGGQGFLVLAASGGAFTMDDAVKAHSSQPYLKSNEIVKLELKLKLSCNANTYSDEAIVSFNNSNSEGGSEKFYSMYSNAPELWSVKNANNYSINLLGELDLSKVIPLTVKAGVAGDYTLIASQVESFGNSLNIRLEDRTAGIFTSLSNTPEYTFQVNEPGTITDRFFLRFIDVTSVADFKQSKEFNVFAKDGKINIQSLQQQSGKVAVFDMLGHRITTGRIDAGAYTQINMNGKSGVYIVSVITDKGINNTKIIVK